MYNYETDYQAMRAAAVRVTGDLIKRLTKACQSNPWLRTMGADFCDESGDGDGFCLDSDYPYYLERYDDVSMLEKFFENGNWSIRTAVQHKDLIFVNQINGGDEWWTLKIDGDNLVPFESISFRYMIERGGEFAKYIERLCGASVQSCKALAY